MAKKKHPHRRPLLGLTPASVVAEMARSAHGKLRGVRGETPVEERAVLPASRESGAGEAGAVRIPGADSGGEAVSDASRSSGGDAFSAQLSRVLKRLLGERAPAIDGIRQSALGGWPTNAEALAAVIQGAALEGKQWACEFWRDMAEGKPVRAAQQDNSELEVENQLDRVSLAALNRLSEKKDSK